MRAGRIGIVMGAALLLAATAGSVAAQPPLEEEPAVSMELITAMTEPQTGTSPGGEAIAAMPQGVVPLEVLEREMILRSLDQTSGNRTQAAQLLGISVRTLRNKLNEYRQQGMVIE